MDKYEFKIHLFVWGSGLCVGMFTGMVIMKLVGGGG